jgi:hypothetical protein
MLRQAWRILPKRACIAGGLLAGLCFPLLAEDLPAPAPASTAKETPKPAEPAAANPDAAEPAPGDAVTPAEKHLLAFKFKPDQVVRYNVEYEMELTTHLNGTTEIARNKSESRRAYKVTQVSPDQEGDLQLSIEWVHMIAQFDNGISKTKPVEFQSDDPTKRPLQFQHILATVGTPQATIRFSPSGRPLKVEILKGAVAANTDPAKAAASDQPAPKGAAANAAADASHENYLIPLPQQAVAVGETWKERYDVTARDNGNLPVRITMQRSYKLAEVGDGRATIEFRTAILTPVTAPEVAAQLMQRETTGKFVFDIEQGLIVSREANCDKLVHDALGAKSSTKAVSKYREKLISVTATAGRDESAATTTAKQ